MGHGYVRSVDRADARLTATQLRYLEPKIGGAWGPVTLNRPDRLSFYFCSGYAYRTLTGRSLYCTDRGHLHHCLLRRGLSIRVALLVVAALCLVAVVGVLAIGIGVTGAMITSSRGDDSVELDPSEPMAYVDLARALEADGRPREALAVLGWAQQVVPGSMDVSLLRAKLLLHLERVPEVIRELTAAAALDPRRANEPLGNLGTVYYDSQQFDRAVPVLERAVQLEDGDAHSHFYLGSIYARRLEEPGRAEKAVDHLLRAAQIQPDYSRPWMAAAAVLRRMGYLPEAAACLRRAIDGEYQSDAPYVRLAELLQLQGRLPERQLVLKQYAAVRDHDLTRTGLEKETRDNPRDAARRCALGDLLLREGRPEKALPELLAAAGMHPNWKQAQARLADACALLGYDDLREEAERAAR